MVLSVMSLIPTMSIAAPCFLAERRKLRPMRPKPLMPTLTDMAMSLLGGCGWRWRDPSENACSRPREQTPKLVPRPNRARRGTVGRMHAAAHPSPFALLVAALVAALLATIPLTPARAAEASRLAGATRVDTAVAISQAAFPLSADTVYLARADVFADALAAGALTDGPILLVPSCGEVPTEVAAEIARLEPLEVVALGGESAVCSDAVGGRSRRPRGRPAGRPLAHRHRRRDRAAGRRRCGGRRLPGERRGLPGCRGRGLADRRAGAADLRRRARCPRSCTPRSPSWTPPP